MMFGGFAVVANSGCMAMRTWQLEAKWKGEPAPDFELAALDGGTVTLSEFQGRPMLLSFFGAG